MITQNNVRTQKRQFIHLKTVINSAAKNKKRKNKVKKRKQTSLRMVSSSGSAFPFPVLFFLTCITEIKFRNTLKTV